MTTGSVVCVQKGIELQKLYGALRLKQSLVAHLESLEIRLLDVIKEVDLIPNDIQRQPHLDSVSNELLESQLKSFLAIPTHNQTSGYQTDNRNGSTIGNEAHHSVFDHDQRNHDPSEKISAEYNGKFHLIISNLPKEEVGYLTPAASLTDLSSTKEPVSSGSNINASSTKDSHRLLVSPPAIKRLAPWQFYSVEKISLSNQSSEYWVGGKTGILGSITADSVSVLENNMKAGLEEPIQEIIRTKTRICAVRNKHSVDVLHQDGKLNFRITLKDYLSIQEEYLVSWLATSLQDFLILGSSEGTILIVKIEPAKKSFQVTHEIKDHIKRVNSLVWVNEKQQTFVSCSQDKTILKYQLQANEGSRLLARFVYDQPVMRCCRSHDLLVAAFAKGTISIIEHNKGSVLLTMTVSSGQAEDPSRDAAEEVRTQWMGCIYLAPKAETEQLAKRALVSQTDFVNYISILRVLIKNEEPKIHVVGYPRHSSDNFELDLFATQDFADAKLHKRIPVLLEQVDQHTTLLRAFAWQMADRNRTQATILSELAIRLERTPSASTSNPSHNL